MSKKYFVQRHLSSFFRRLGQSAGRNPWWFSLVPLIITIVLSVRICWVSLTTEVEYLYSPINCRALKERNAIETMFPPTEEGTSMVNLMRFRRMATILMEAKDGQSVLREDILREVAHIDSIVYNITVFHEGRNYTYAELCSKWRSRVCQPNDVLYLLGKTEKIKNRELRIRYPVHIEPFSQVRIYAIGLGGVVTDEEDNVIDAKAVRLVYILDDSTEEKDVSGYKWENSFQKVLLNSKFRSIKVSLATAQSIDVEFSRITEMALPLMMATSFIMIIFASVSCMTTDWITSKPWVAVAGCVSPVLAVSSAFGFLLLCGFEYVDLNIIIIFLLVGIGLDDSFVMLSAWRRTDPRKEVSARMSQTYEESAISITITSLTNLVTLCVGITIPYRIVRLYCCYAAMSVVFAYIYQITFFGGILAVSGRREKRRRHPLLCITVKKEHAPRSFLLKLLYIGYMETDNEERRNQKAKSAFMDSFLASITTARGKSIVLACFLIYLSTSMYCLKFVKERFDYRNAMPHSSYLVDYFNMHYKHFTHYPHTVHVAINKTLDYSSKEVQRDVKDMMESICNLPNMAGNKCTISWLDYYLRSVNESFLRLSYRGYNFSHPEDFISGLRDVFLRLPHGMAFIPSIRFNHNKTQIVASRFIALSTNVGTYEKERTLISTLLSKVDSFKYPVHIYNIWFSLYSIFLEINSSTTETLCSAALTVVVIFFIFVPHLVCLVGIVLTIISIQIGVVGYMSVWGVPLNPVSMVCLIISVGLSVDYAAHICYAYLCCKEEDPDEKTKVALRHAGYPIIQGCLSTILGVLVLGFGPSNVFLVFFKVVTLVMLISAFHGLLVIPVMLNLLEIWWKRFRGRYPKIAQRCQASRRYSKTEQKFPGEEHSKNVSQSLATFEDAESAQPLAT